MESEAVGRASPEKSIVQTSAPKLGEQHQDVEGGHEMVNIDRIEKVYE
jgi:hypothetical protein